MVPQEKCGSQCSPGDPAVHACCSWLQSVVWYSAAGEGSTIMDLEDFIVSNNLLPLGSLGYVLFCTRKNGWGWDGFMDETNAGEGIKFPAALRAYVTWFLPLLIAFIYLKGYYDMFSGKDTLTFVCWMIAAVVFLWFICWCAWKKPAAKKAV